MNVDASVETININAVATKSTSKVEGSGSKSLQTGLNTFNITVEAEDGTSTTYVIVVNKAASSNNYLASLLSDQTLTPEFNRNTLNYTVNVPNNVTTINVNGVAEDVKATVDGNGVSNLNVGHNTITITVTAENNTFRAYTIDVYREASSNNYLSDLKVDDATVKDFNREKQDYTMTVENDVVDVSITGVVEDSTATITGDGTIYLTTGLNKVNITVTAQNGDARIYTISITRKKSSNNFLTILSSKEGTLSPSFTKENTDYTMQVPYEITKLNLTTVAEDANATIEVEGNSDFSIGSDNTVFISVTAEDGTTKTYKIKVTRLPQANNYLSDLKVKSKSGKEYNLSPSFDKNTLNYSISIDEDDTDLVIEGTKEATSSTSKGLGDIKVTAFPYNAQVVVTSAGGIDRTYTITINKNKSNNADLKDVVVDQGTLSPAFDKDTLNYTVNVDSSIDTINISTVTNKYQTVAGDGSHSLSYGNNVIPLVVTAEDGTTKTYTITVVREKEVITTLDDIKIVNGSLSPNFKSEVLDYIAYIGDGATDLTITPTITDILSSFSISLNDGEYKDINSITVSDLDKDNVVKIKVKNGDKETIYTVTVLNQSGELITSEKYGHDISDGMIKTVRIDTSASELKDQLDNDNKYLKVFESDGVTEYTGDNIATGMIVKLYKNDKVVDQKIVVVKGDVDGNGQINAIDALKVVNHIIGNDTLSGCYLEAADTTNDKEINAIDALRIVNHIIGSVSLF